MERVDIYHPVTGGTHRTTRRALGHWISIGWREVEKTPARPEPRPQPQSEPAPAPEQGTEETPARSRKRREPSESEEQ